MGFEGAKTDIKTLNANGKWTTKLNTVRITFLLSPSFDGDKPLLKGELKLLQNKSVVQNKLSIEHLILYYRLILYHPESCTICNILSELLI